MKVTGEIDERQGRRMVTSFAFPNLERAITDGSGKSASESTRPRAALRRRGRRESNAEVAVGGGRTVGNLLRTRLQAHLSRHNAVGDDAAFEDGAPHVPMRRMTVATESQSVSGQAHAMPTAGLRPVDMISLRDSATGFPADGAGTAVADGASTFHGASTCRSPGFCRADDAVGAPSKLGLPQRSVTDDRLRP